MKKLLSIIVVCIFICAVCIVSVQAASMTQNSESEPGVTITMAPIFTTFKALAKVPDPALKSALHDAVGIPQSASLYVEDLESLSGVLQLNELGITDLTGIQHCINIEQLLLNDNELSSVIYDIKELGKLKLISLEGNNFTVVPKELYNIPKLETLLMQNNPITVVEPGMKFLNYLSTVHLANCELTSFPEEVLLDKLEYLSLSNNNIGAIPEEIALKKNLTTLLVDNTGLTELPSALQWMNLKTLSAANNNISELRHSIQGMNSCEYLNLSGNDLTSLGTVFYINNLRNLNVNYNNLKSLPEIVNCKDSLEKVTARGNNITEVDDFIIVNNTLKYLDLTFNKITHLPGDMASLYFDYLGLSFNYLDISTGSSTLSILEGIGGDVEYIPQIEPPKGLKAQAQENEVELSWDACPEGSFDAGELQVVSYTVYAVNGSAEKLAQLPATELSFRHTGLLPDTAYEYRITVNYRISFGTRASKRYCSNSAQISVQTLPDSAQQDSPQTTGSPSQETDGSGLQTEPGDDKTESADNVSAGSVEVQQRTFPAWAIVLASAAGALVLGAVIFFVMSARRNKSGKGEESGGE